MTELTSTPDDPFALLADWLAHAASDSGMVNHNTMMLATVDADGRPSVRAVLLKGFERETGGMTFYTNYTSRKAQAIEANPNVAIMMHWDGLERQVRVEGRAERVAPEISDAYFASRPRDHQIGAWASDQSKSIAPDDSLLARVVRAAERFGDGVIERPPHWGGYCVEPHTIEFWQGQPGRIHDRLRYERSDTGWDAHWLFP